MHSKNNVSFWWCRCDCGVEKKVGLNNLKSGSIKSCGCLGKELRAKKSANKFTPSPTWWTWNAMTRRCSDTNFEGFANYGGRGIKVCRSWGRYENFLADMGTRPHDATIERRDVNGRYDKSNCVWATRLAQARNTRMRKTNTSGFTGVTKYGKRWKARINISVGVRKNIGVFDTPEEAHLAREKAKILYWGAPESEYR